MECVYGSVKQELSESCYPGSDMNVVPPSGEIVDYVQRRRMRGKIEKKSTVSTFADAKKPINITQYARQVNDGDKNTYYYKLNTIERRSSRSSAIKLRVINIKKRVHNINDCLRLGFVVPMNIVVLLFWVFGSDKI